MLRSIMMMMRKRDRQSEILVALAVTVTMAFALALGIILSLGDDSNENNDTSTETFIATSRTGTVDFVAETEEVAIESTVTSTAEASPVETIQPSNTPTGETQPSDTPTEESPPVQLETDEALSSETPTEEPSPTETEKIRPSQTPTKKPSPVKTEAAALVTEEVQTPTPTPTKTQTPTDTPSHTPTPSATPTFTLTFTLTPSLTPTFTPTRQILFPVTFTPTVATSTPSPTLTTVPLVTVPAPTTTPLPPTPVCVQPTDWQVYIVQAGDTFFSLARKFKINMDELAAANCLTDTDRIYAGQPLLVPPEVFNPEDAAVQKCDTPYAQIINPVPGQALDGVVTLQGIATGPNFRRYVIDWRPEVPGEAYRSFAEVFENKPETADLAAFNTDAFEPGLYWFNLFVLDGEDKLIGDCAIRVRFK